jgi:hypothetical protein
LPQCGQKIASYLQVADKIIQTIIRTVGCGVSEDVVTRRPIDNGTGVFNSWDEARKGDPSAGISDKVLDAAIEIAEGIGITASAIFHFPEDVAKLVTGTDSRFGERRPWRYIGEQYRQSPITPIINTIDAAVGMFWGGLDLVSGHLLNLVFNDKMGLGIKYFSPPPRDVRGVSADLSMAVFMLGMPTVKAKALEAVGLPAETALGHSVVPEYRVGIVESLRGDLTSLRDGLHSVVGRLYKRLTTEGAIPTIDGGFIDITGLRVLLESGLYNLRAGLYKLYNLGNILNERLAAQGRAPFDAGFIDIPWRWSLLRESKDGVEILELIKAGKTSEALSKLIELAEKNVYASMEVSSLASSEPGLFAPEHVPILIRVAKTRMGVAEALRRIAEARPDLFSEEHIAGLIEVARESYDAILVLRDFAIKRSDWSARMIAGLIDIAAEGHTGAISILCDLAILWPKLFTSEHRIRLIEISKRQRGAAEILHDLIEGAPRLFTSEDIPELIEVAEIHKGVLPHNKDFSLVLRDLAIARPDLALPIVRGLGRLEPNLSPFMIYVIVDARPWLAPDIFRTLLGVVREGKDVSWAVSALYCLVKYGLEESLPGLNIPELVGLVTIGDVYLLLEAARGCDDAVRLLSFIAKTRDDLSPQIIIGLREVRPDIFGRKD